MLRDQGGKCAICEVEFVTLTKRPCVDHNHSTGRVRALLCTACNVRVGVVEGEAPWRASVLSYLERHGK